MFGIPLVTSSECFNVPLFWEIILLYHNRPYLINKLVTAITKIQFYKVDFKGSNDDLIKLFSRHAILYERRKCKKLSKESIPEDFIKNFIEPYYKNVLLTKVDDNDFYSESCGIFIQVQLLISRKDVDHKILEISIFDKNKNSATFIGAYEEQEQLISPKFPYQFELTGKTLKINIQDFEDANSPQADWLADVLFPKLLKWSEHQPKTKHCINTLSLIEIDEYSMVYSRLKKTYVDDLLKDWLKNTNTDPQKYIFEDLAIASYLICLWKDHILDDIDFVDCGCGNGLLVYILNQEGYKGYGIDIRKRAIWDVYGDKTKLEVGVVTPDSRFPKSTWLIGNHSDELTPWIPVIALKSSPNTNFFLLPCCSYDFNGEKFIRVDSSLSTYSDYLNYITMISKKCGFNTELDKLRIPSTKKICLVGTRTINNKEMNNNFKEIEELLEIKLKTNFKPRSAIEPVKNCTKLKRNLTDKLVAMCCSFLMEEVNLITNEEGKFWNKGKSMLISEISQKIPQEDLKELKAQCGGLQTLFKNFRYVFELDRGYVSIRPPTTINITKDKYKSKPCWFFKNNPDGCLNTAENCSYFHGE